MGRWETTVQTEIKPSMKRIHTAFVALLLATTGLFAQKSIDLSGRWGFALDPDSTLNAKSEMTDSVSLPGTTDTNRRGNILTDRSVTTHLSRPYSYKGRAWYRRDVTIPSDWQGSVYLTLERTKPTEVYVDGIPAGSSTDISTPQEYDLSKLLTPGRHTIAIMVDNSRHIPWQIYANSHAYTEDTQTNWNGIIGRIELSNKAYTTPKPTETHPALRDFRVDGRKLYANGHRLFLRGRHDACVWPLTGHVAMDIDSWRHYFDICREYGLNHVRFHSWCPPEAAFAAADEAGIFLQPELPIWGSLEAGDSILLNFLHKEGENILKYYGHHPSFRLFALGNELSGDIDVMARLVEDFRAIAPDKLYTFGSNYYLGRAGIKPGMDFYVTCRVGVENWGEEDTHVRGSFAFVDALDGGIINRHRPNASINFESGCSRSDIPVISHETAQFQSYPDYDEINKYTGALYPCNMEIFRDRLEKAGMLDQAKDFHRASGAWASRLYKQDIEMDLRTPGMAGFQLLDLQDYPGQGSAYIGMLEAFLDSKGFITPQQWRGFCSPVVPLLVADEYCFSQDKPLSGKIQIANYDTVSVAGKTLLWTLGKEKGTLTIPEGEGLIDVGNINIPLGKFKTPCAEVLTLAVEGTDWQNEYEVWIYPAKNDISKAKSGIIETDRLTADIISKLESGANVLLTPDSSALTVGPLFETDYWNYRMFKTISENNGKPVSPGTLGILTDPKHPIFEYFPTQEHTNWQWFPVIRNSRPFMLDNTGKDYRPIVQVIDNVERNHKLGLVFEFAVGKGKLLIVMADLDRAAEYPEGRQFYYSVLRYMSSKSFDPDTKISADALGKLLTTPVSETRISELNNISPY